MMFFDGIKRLIAHKEIEKKTENSSAISFDEN